MEGETHVPWYPSALDFDALHRDYPPPPDYFRTTRVISRDELRAKQETRFAKTIERGWEIPFFQRHWKNAGIAPGDIRGLDDLARIPPYTVFDIRDSIARAPPFGDFMGLSPADGKRMPLVFHTSGGTTGTPRPMLYSPQDRQVMGILGGRRFAMAGVKPGDLVMITYAAGLWNGAIAKPGRANARPAWSGVSTTSSGRQVNARPASVIASWASGGVRQRRAP